MIVDLDSWPSELHIVNLYLHTGAVAGGLNAQLLASIGALIHEIDRPVVVAGDWNLPPGELESSDFNVLSSRVIEAPTTVACRGGAGSTIIDYFAFNSAGARAFAGVCADLLWPKRLYRPVIFTLKGHASQLKKLVYLAAPTFGKKVVFGPRPARILGSPHEYSLRLPVMHVATLVFRL